MDIGPMHTTEAAFQDALDRNPSDHAARGAFADWLDEQGDPRAEGYRALARLQRVPHINNRQIGGRAVTWGMSGIDGYLPYPYWLPRTWAVVVERGDPARPWGQERVFTSRREAEDAAALAFAQLPAERRAELLASGV